MKYRIDCWIPVEPDEPVIYDDLGKAIADYDSQALMQPENKYELILLNDDGEEI
jgi:hypothetical protein